MLSLYFGIGKFISDNSRNNFWGTSALETISVSLQQELPGLRGFSPANLKRMRQFYEEWEHCIQKTDNQRTEFRPTVSDEIQTDILLVNHQSKTDEISTSNRPTLSGEIINLPLNSFLSFGFSHHHEILVKAKALEERLFYIERCATEFWSYRTLQYHLKGNLFGKSGELPNIFQKKTISDIDLRRKALFSFKDEYLLDYINIESPDDEWDELVLENEIVNNIRILLCRW